MNSFQTPPSNIYFKGIRLLKGCWSTCLKYAGENTVKVSQLTDLITVTHLLGRPACTTTENRFAINLLPSYNGGQEMTLGCVLVSQQKPFSLSLLCVHIVYSLLCRHLLADGQEISQTLNGQVYHSQWLFDTILW